MNGTSLDIIFTQLEVLWVLLSRPVVQRQLIAVAIVIVLAWLLNRAILAWIYPRLAPRARAEVEKSRTRRFYRLFQITKYLFFPVIGLFLIPLAVSFFERQEYPAGLVENAAIIFWIMLAYEIVLGLLSIWFDEERTQFIRKRILLPLFIAVPSVIFLNQFIDVRSILSIPVFEALEVEITLGNLVLAGLWFYGFVILSWVVVGFLQRVILPRTQASTGVIHSVTTISRYIFKILGALVVISTLGVDLTSLALIGTGLTIGIGFGLQQVVSNFISGIMLLFEQSLRPGDFVEIDNQVGTVQELNMRSTVIRTVDAEIVVPNETFLTQQLVTYTKSNMLARVQVPVGVSYESDPEEVRRLLIQTAVQHELVVDDPQPVVFFDNFGDSSLDFRLVAWIEEPRSRIMVASDLRYMIWVALRDHDIEIPFPQRDLNLGDGWQALTGAMLPENGEPPRNERQLALPVEGAGACHETIEQP